MTTNMIGTQPCSICRQMKRIVRYVTQGKYGTRSHAVLLCDRCDLSPDPPVRRN